MIAVLIFGVIVMLAWYALAKYLDKDDPDWRNRK